MSQKDSLLGRIVEPESAAEVPPGDERFVIVGESNTSVYLVQRIDVQEAEVPKGFIAEKRSIGGTLYFFANCRRYVLAAQKS